MDNIQEQAACLLQEIESLAEDLCLDLGFCGGVGTGGASGIVAALPLDARSFPEFLLAAEGPGIAAKLYGPLNLGWLLERGDKPAELGPYLTTMFERRFGAALNPGTRVIAEMRRQAADLDMPARDIQRKELRINLNDRLRAEFDAALRERRRRQAAAADKSAEPAPASRCAD